MSAEPPLDTMLITKEQSKNIAWSIYTGYKIKSWLGVEIKYLKLPCTKLFFPSDSTYSIGSNSQPFTINTQTTCSQALIRLNIYPSEHTTIYTLVGPSITQRKDSIAKMPGVGASFNLALGFVKNKFEQSIEIGLLTGKSKVDMTSVKDYLPFVTTVMINIQRSI